VDAYDTAVEDLPLSVVDDYDVVIASTDNLVAEVNIGRVCLALSIPLIYASVHGPTLTVQVRTFSNRGPESACPACGLNRAEWRQLNEQVRFSCDPGSIDRAADIVGPPTMSVSPLCSMAADLAVLVLLRLQLGLGPPLEDSVTEYNGYGHTTSVSVLAPSPRCPVDHAHTVLDRAEAGQPLADLPLRACAAAAGVTDEADLERTSFAVDDLVFGAAATCPACCAEQPLNRFVHPEARLRRRCRACGAPGLVPHPSFSFERFVCPGPGAVALLDKPLRALGATPRGVIVRGPAGAVLVRHQTADGGNAP
jgi:uncharacterized protein (DUF983 family)